MDVVVMGVEVAVFSPQRWRMSVALLGSGVVWSSRWGGAVEGQLVMRSVCVVRVAAVHFWGGVPMMVTSSMVRGGLEKAVILRRSVL